MLEMPAVPEPGVHEADGHGTFAHGRSHAFDRSTSYVSRREHAGSAGLEQVRLVPELLWSALPRRAGGVVPGKYETTIIEGELAFEPARIRLGADEDEEIPRLEPWYEGETTFGLAVP
ncbi:MAG TPA: hypothetical protein VFH32_01990, partial [Rubrobacteraceae bacterium]|nr:hypothetical protein [Rubrobacteraceae bacterium]